MRFGYSAGLVPLLLLVLVGCDQENQSDGASAPAPPVVTAASPLVRELVEWDEFTGRFEAKEHVEIRARVSGYLDSVHFEDGQIVEKDQLLFVIDQRPFAIDVEQASASVRSAEAATELAVIELERARSLVDRAAVARSILDERIQQHSQAVSNLDLARAVLHGSELDLEFTEVRAAIAGRISDRRVDVGNLVTTDTMLTTIVALDPIYFTFDMSEADFLAYQRAVMVGDLPSTRDQSTIVGVKLVDEDAWAREGRMNFVDNVVDASSGTVRARAIIGNPTLLIAPGQFGRIRLPGSPNYAAIMVPDSAVVTDQSRKIVMTIDENNVVEPRIIDPGPRQLGLRIVRRGLDAEDRIIINGLMRVRPGMTVTPEDGVIEPIANDNAS